MPQPRVPSRYQWTTLDQFAGRSSLLDGLGDMEPVHGAEMGGGTLYECPTEVLQVDGVAPEQAHTAYVAFRGWSEDSKRRLDAQVVWER